MATLPTINRRSVTSAVDYGMSAAASGTTNSAALQAAMDVARRVAKDAGQTRFATVVLPAGTIGIGTGMTSGFDCGWVVDPLGGSALPQVRFVGQGRGATILIWDQGNDLGFGKIAFDYTNAASGLIAMQDISIYGPGSNNTRLGRPPGKAGGGYIGMHGVKLGGACTLLNFEAQRWNYGIYAWRDHNKMVDVYSGSSYFGVYVDTDNPIANNGYVRCHLDGNLMASIGCSKKNGILADYLDDSHLGFSPFGIYQVNTDPSITSALFISNSTFNEVAFESCGHGAIISEDRTGDVPGFIGVGVTASGVPDTNFRIGAVWAASITSGSAVVTCAGTNQVEVGSPVSGNAGIPAGTTVLSVTDGNHFLMSAPATANASGLTLQVPLVILGAATTNGSATITCTTTNGLNPGMPIAGAGIPAGAVIRDITDATRFRLWSNATATASGLTLTISYRRDYAISVRSWSGTKLYGTADLYTGCAGTEGCVDAPVGFSSNECDSLAFESMWNANKCFLSKTRITGAATTNTSPTVTCDDTSKLRAGSVVEGAGIPNGTNVLSITDATTFVLNANANATASGLTLVNRFTAISESGGGGNRMHSSLVSGRIEIAGSTITKGDLLTFGGTGGFWRVKRYIAGSGAKCIGIAANDALQGEFVGVYDRGAPTGNPGTGFVSAGFGGPIKPHPTEDGKFASGVYGTDQIIGFTRNGNVIDLAV